MCGSAVVHNSGFASNVYTAIRRLRHRTYLTVDGGPRSRAQRELPPGLLELLQPVHPTLRGARGKDMFAVSCAEIMIRGEVYVSCGLIWQRFSFF